MKYHIERGCMRSYDSARLTRAQFVNTLSSQRCQTCERMAFGGSVHRAMLVERGAMIEAKEGETMRLTSGGAAIIRKGTKFTENELRDIAGYCEAAADQYLKDAAACGEQPNLAEQFRQQSAAAKRMAERIFEEIG
jgi:hypothetical protein